MMLKRAASVSFELDSRGSIHVRMVLHQWMVSGITCMTDASPPRDPNKSSSSRACKAALAMPFLIFKNGVLVVKVLLDFFRFVE